MVHQGVFQRRRRLNMNRDPSERDDLFSELTSFLSDAAEAAIVARMKLRDTVCAFVAAEEARGVSLKSVIQAVKEILRAEEKDAIKSPDELAAQLVNWCRECHNASRPAGPVAIS